MKIPAKWPGRKKFSMLCTAMLLIDTSPFADWRAVARSQDRTLKKHYHTLAYHMREAIEFHSYQQKGNHNDYTSKY